MNIHEKRPFDPDARQATPETVFMTRRKWLHAGAYGTAAAALAGGYFWWQSPLAGESDIIGAGRWSPAAEQKFAGYFPATRDERFAYGRAETARLAAARYTNFYEFSRYKWCWKYVAPFQPEPWTIAVDGLCRNPLRLDLDEFYRRFAGDLVERQYRHRCVERWAMAIPWTGIPLAALLKAADPLASATHVRFVSFERPSQAPNQAASEEFPWPYTEGLTIAEGQNDLAFLATGVYGQPLLKQHGAPLRMVVPWKYGYKSAKSIVRIELIGREPATFWSTLNLAAYPFQSNIEPEVPRPWNQSHETMLGTDERIATQKYNGYEKWVAELYES
jgi:sulfoxide reductase catalytic subunit YedY